MGVVLLDSAPIVGFLESTNVFHAAASKAIADAARSHDLIISIITLAELLTGARRGHRNEEVVRGFMRDLIGEIVPVERLVAERAAELRGAKQSLKMPDALILATADLRAERAVTCDKGLEGLDVACEVERLIAAPQTEPPNSAGV